MRRLVTLLLAGLVLASAAGCAGPSGAPAGRPGVDGGSGAASITPPPAATGGTPSVGARQVAQTLRFTAPLVGGGQFDGASLADRPAVLWFWAAWCVRCRAKAADVAALSDEVAGRAQVVGVAGLGSGDAAMREFVAGLELDAFPHLADDNGVVWRRFGVTEQEYFVLIDASGGVAHRGPLSGDDLRRRVSALTG